MKASSAELKKEIMKHIKALSKQSAEKRIDNRIEKFSGMGAYQ